MDSSKSETVPVYKVLLVGDAGVGKTSIAKRYVKNEFDPNNKATIGVDFLLKSIPLEDAEVDCIRLQVWDIAGQERFAKMLRSYYQNASAMLIAYDIQNKERGLKEALEWCNLEQYPDLAKIPVCVAANKCDRGMERVILFDGSPVDEEFLEEKGLTAIFPCSAKDDLGVTECFEHLVISILESECALDLSKKMKEKNTVTLERAPSDANFTPLMAKNRNHHQEEKSSCAC